MNAMTTTTRLDTFTRAYVECALWSSTDVFDDGSDATLEAIGYTVDNIAPDTLAMMVAECAAFQRDHAADIATGDIAGAGHDFWLTRNGHGAGFWDGDWQEDVGRRLTDAAHAYGEVNLYVGDDGRISA